MPRFYFHLTSKDTPPIPDNSGKELVSLSFEVTITGSIAERPYVEDAQKLTGRQNGRAYRGHDTENPRRVFISGQMRGVFGITKSPELN
jgi:hypothetical protein